MREKNGSLLFATPKLSLEDMTYVWEVCQEEGPQAKIPRSTSGSIARAQTLRLPLLCTSPRAEGGVGRSCQWCPCSFYWSSVGQTCSPSAPPRDEVFTKHPHRLGLTSGSYGSCPHAAGTAWYWSPSSARKVLGLSQPEDTAWGSAACTAQPCVAPPWPGMCRQSLIMG